MPIPSGRRAYTYVTVYQAGQPFMDGDGHWQTPYTELPLPWFVTVEPATATDQERRMAGTITVNNTVVVTGPFRPDVNTDTRLQTTDGAMLDVLSVASPQRRNIELIVICTETGE